MDKGGGAQHGGCAGEKPGGKRREPINLAQYRKIAEALNRDLEATFAKHGLKMGKLSAGIDDFAGTVRYTITASDANLKDKDGNATTPEAQHFKRMAELCGLKPEWFGLPFKNGTRDAKIVGMRLGKSAKSILFEMDGKTFVMTPEEAKMRIEWTLKKSATAAA